MAVSIDRYFAIHKPIHSKLLCSHKRILLTIVTTWLLSFFLMIPLIIHHRIVDPFDITITTCAEEWHRNMNARLIYDFILLLVLFIIPLTFMSYCYIKISWSLWHIDPNVSKSIQTWSQQKSNRSLTTTSEHQNNHNLLMVHTRPYYIHHPNNKLKHHIIVENGCTKDNEYQSLMQQKNNPRLSTTMTNLTRKSLSTSATTNIISNNLTRRSSSLLTNHPQHRRMSFAGHIEHNYSCQQQSPQLKKSTIVSLQCCTNGGANDGGLRGTSMPILHGSNRSITEFERANRFSQSRRRVIKLLITLVIVFFVTRLPSNIIGIYIDITSGTFLPDDYNSNQTTSLDHLDKKMLLILYVNPLLQLFSLANSAINPICYCIMSRAIGNIIALIRERCHRRKKASSLTLIHRHQRQPKQQKTLPSGALKFSFKALQRTSLS
ncbi:unnamed protein product [Didymodactylos carnosus]|uniref:G-protein coupled receptors family 1 profile domain-containing protein n=1 Tax=Didymodactylos carnosus TaxID=1234261 RepID=A0A815HB39_9BILA|nr:unnamed protein product [Didymodactylos carnosus]CAF1349959.1 unnamed protein product [Didymodactylos carnosus]CAF4014340.1 unnamed protein product [Didymodactylos carnosus]CAF4219166.1 unnamed protein product [Didymodactylos carnosus]